MSFKNMKIKILSREHLHSVLEFLQAEGYVWRGNADNIDFHIVEYLYTYSHNGNITWGRTLDEFNKHENPEVTLEQKPVEYFFKPISRYNFKMEGNDLFINGFKVKQEDLNNFLSNANG